MKRTLLAILVVLAWPVSALAIGITTSQEQSVLYGTEFLDQADTNSSCQPSTTDSGSLTPGPIYIVGDSITVRMQDELTQKLTNKGWRPKINAVVSRPLRNPGFSGGDGFKAVDQDASFIKTAKAIVVELGTNPSGIFSQDLKDFIAKLRGLNQNATIFWANLASNKPDASYLAAISAENQAIISQSSSLNYQVIDWFKTVFTSGDATSMNSQLDDTNSYLFTGDGLNVHPTIPAGVSAYSDLIVNALSPSTSDTTGNSNTCSCPTTVLSGENNVQMSFNFFVSKGLTPPQSAGIVGNAMAETGQDINPKAHNDINGGHTGIFQWDDPGRWANLVKFAQAHNEDPFSLQLQLEYTWFELTGQPPTKGASGGAESAAYTDIKTTNTPADAATSFDVKFERNGPPGQPGPDISRRVGYAEQVFAKYGGSSGGGGSSSGDCGSVDGYRNPFWKIPASDLNPLRIDQGVDYGRQGDIYAIGPATVELVIPSNSGWGTVNSGSCIDSNSASVIYRFTSGAAAGKTVFVVECFTVDPNLKEGQQIDSGTLIGHMYGPIEIGWGIQVPQSTPVGDRAYNQAEAHNQPYCSPPFAYEANGAPSSSTALGTNFSQFLVKLGAPAGITQATSGGCLPAGWPKWS